MTTFNLDQAIVELDQEIEIRASPGDVFEGMLHRLSAGHEGPPDNPVPMILERWAGGRWFRDLGNGSGHLWGFVQSIKPPSLIELFGPMFMSYPAINHLIIRLQPVPEGTQLSFKYKAFGMLSEDHRTGVVEGFSGMLSRLKASLEA